MPISAGAGMAILGGANIVGGILQGNSARSAANTSAQAQLQAAQIAADAARFRPVGLNLYSQGLGESRFQTDAQGNVIGAEISSSPQFQNYQQTLARMQEQQLAEAERAPQQYAPLQGAAGGLFSLGQQYLAQSPEQVAQQYISRQQDLLAPSRERQYAQVQNQLFNTGRGGLSVGATGLRPSGGMGLSAANPEMEAYYNALAQLLPDYGINTPQRIAAFIAQCAHESGNFVFLKENLNYKAATLRKLFAKYFPTDELANEYANKPNKQEAIANRIYANRMGNGDEASGDGFRYCVNFNINSAISCLFYFVSKSICSAKK